MKEKKRGRPKIKTADKNIIPKYYLKIDYGIFIIYFD